MDLTQAIQHIMPDAQFVIRGNTYEGIEWMDERPMPTQKEVEDAIEYLRSDEYKAIQKNEMISRQRAKKYRNESDPIFFKWQRGEATEQEWKDKVAEIRERIPKK